MSSDFGANFLLVLGDIALYRTQKHTFIIYRLGFHVFFRWNFFYLPPFCMTYRRDFRAGLLDVDAFMSSSASRFVDAFDLRKILRSAEIILSLGRNDMVCSLVYRVRFF